MNIDYCPKGVVPYPKHMDSTQCNLLISVPAPQDFCNYPLRELLDSNKIPYTLFNIGGMRVYVVSAPNRLYFNKVIQTVYWYFCPMVYVHKGVIKQ